MKNREKKVIIANWKMHKSLQEAKDFVKNLLQLEKKEDQKVMIAAPFTYIQTLSELTKDSSIWIGGQNMNEAKQGAFTGEIAGQMLLDVGAKFVLLGHSERRNIYGETDDQIHEKVQRALADGLVPVLCVGENGEEREQQKTEEILEQQILACLANVSKKNCQKIILAYEPIWAIGTGKAATATQAEEAHQICRKIIEEKFDSEVSQNLPILYGGSVNAENAKNFLEKEDVDGLLIGGASLSLESFSKIIYSSN